MTYESLKRSCQGDAISALVQAEEINQRYELLYHSVLRGKSAKLYRESIMAMFSLLAEYFEVELSDLYFLEYRPRGLEKLYGSGQATKLYRPRQIESNDYPTEKEVITKVLKNDAEQLFERPPVQLEGGEAGAGSMLHPEIKSGKALANDYLRIPVSFDVKGAAGSAEPEHLGVFYVGFKKGRIGASRQDKDLLEAAAKLHESQMDKLIVMSRCMQEINLKDEFDELVDREPGDSAKLKALLGLILAHTEADQGIVSMAGEDGGFAHTTMVKAKGALAVDAYWRTVEKVFGEKGAVAYLEGPNSVDYIVKPITDPAARDKLIGGLGLYLSDPNRVFSFYDVYLVEKFARLLDTLIVVMTHDPFDF